jgi:hypothetical protein
MLRIISKPFLTSQLIFKSLLLNFSETDKTLNELNKNNNLQYLSLTNSYHNLNFIIKFNQSTIK